MQRNGVLVKNKYMEYLGSTLAYSISIYLATIVDGMLVGQLIGPESFAAINLTMPVVYLKNIVFMLFINGGTVMAAQFLGERRKNDTNRIFTVSVMGCAAGYLTLLILGMIFADPLSDILSLKGSSREQVFEYLIPLLASGPVMTFTNGIASFLRLDGRHKLATAIPVVANVINLFCDYIFIRFFHWGIAGAGWATVTGYLCSTVLLISYFRDDNRNFRFIMVAPSDLKLLPECLRVGFPMAMIQGCNVLKNYLMNRLVLLGFGDQGGHVIAVCNSGLFYAMMFADGSSTALSSVCGALFGEKDKKGVVSVFRKGLFVSGVLCLAVFALLELFPVQFGMIYKVTEPNEQRMLEVYFRLFALCIPLLAPIYAVRSYYQATRITYAATAISVLDGALVTVPVMFILYSVNKETVWLSNCFGSLLTLVLILVFMNMKAKKSGCENFLMLDAGEEKDSYEFSIDCSEKAAEETSSETIRFLTDRGVAASTGNALGVAAEELCVNISRYAGLSERSQIDVFIKILDDCVLLKVRDEGVLFNPTEFVGEGGEKVTGLSLIRSLGCEIKYDRILGFNNTVITVKNR